MSPVPPGAEPDPASAFPPAFLVGAERSGTTLLRLMLDAHPRLAWANEFEFAVDRMGAAGAWPSLEGYYEFLAAHRVFATAGYEIDRRLAYPDLVRSFLAQRARRAGKPRVGATVHRHFDRLLRLWPDARFLHLVRDPRDVAPSCVAMGWAGNVWTGVARWLEAERLWDALAARVPPERRLELRYEELIAAPERVLAGICDFLELSFDPAMLHYPAHSSYARPDPSQAGKWRASLSDREIRLIEARVGERLAARGYAPSGRPPLAVRGLRRRWLRLQDRTARIRFSLRRHGWRLRLAEWVARRLGLRSWQRRLKRRMNATAQADLK